MSIELTAAGWAGICDDCGKSVMMAATNPKAATTILREHGWRRGEHIGTIRAYLWNCGCDARQATA